MELLLVQQERRWGGSNCTVGVGDGWELSWYKASVSWTTLIMELLLVQQERRWGGSNCTVGVGDGWELAWYKTSVSWTTLIMELLLVQQERRWGGSNCTVGVGDGWELSWYKTSVSWTTLIMELLLVQQERWWGGSNCTVGVGDGWELSWYKTSVSWTTLIMELLLVQQKRRWRRELKLWEWFVCRTCFSWWKQLLAEQFPMHLLVSQNRGTRLVERERERGLILPVLIQSSLSSLKLSNWQSLALVESLSISKETDGAIKTLLAGPYYMIAWNTFPSQQGNVIIA